MFTFIILYFLNLVLDYPLQGTFLAEYKCRGLYKKYMKDFTAYYIDQSLHIVQVLLCLI